MKYKLKDISIIKRGSSPRPINDYIVANGYPWLKISDFALNDRIVSKTHEFIKPEGLKKTRYVKKGTLIVTNSATPGIPIFLGEDMCLHDGFLYFENVDKGVDVDYLYYFILANRKKIIGLGNGSVFVNLKKEIIENYVIDLPKIQEQKKISKILKEIDNKIELNNKINDNLYQQAYAIFEEKIVKFDDIPSGWKIDSLDRIADYINGLAMQKYEPNDGEDSLPVLKIAELKQGYCDSNSSRCTTNLKSNYIINDGDVIFSWSASLVVDLWCGGKAGLNQHLFNVKSDKYDKWFYFLWTKYYLNEFIHEAAAKATTMGHIKRDNLSKSKVLIPNKEVYDQVGAVLSPIIDNIINVKIENKRLVELRDTLLPKLMSGEINVESLDI